MNYYKQNGVSGTELAHAQSGYNPGKFGKVYIAYLQENRRSFYNQLIEANDLSAHVRTIEERADEKYRYYLNKEISRENITDSLKSTNISLWKRKMSAAKKKGSLSRVGVKEKL